MDIAQAALQGQKPLGDSSPWCHRHMELAWCSGMEVTGNGGARAGATTAAASASPPGRSRGTVTKLDRL